MALYSIPNVQLSSGNLNMPLLGLGTASFPAVGSETVGKDSTEEYEVTVKAVVEAIRLGYRHFDTAAIYQTEPAIGEAVAEALRLGLIQSRAELFITSKLWCSDAHAQYVLPALQNTLRNLKLEYLDLYLVHWPVSMKNGHGNYKILPTKENLIPMKMESVWSAMEECQALGLTKSIGVSNFSCKKLQDILAFAKIPPAVNQVEMNPLWQQKKLIEFCKANGILLAAYSPLGAAGTIYGSNRVMECEVLKEIAKAKGKTVAQVCLRWAHEQGGAVVVKSYNKERLKQNIEIFDWGLSDEESKKIIEIPQCRIVCGEIFVSANGPFKSIEELWDGEL